MSVDEVRERTVLVVDDHKTFAEMLSLALDSATGLRSVGVAHTAAEGVALARRLAPDVVVMDIRLAHEDGLAATSRIRELLPSTLVAVVSAHTSTDWVGRAAQAGASAFVPKNGSLQEMIDILRVVRDGHMLVAPSTFAAAAAQTAGPVEAVPELRQREIDALRLLASGVQVREIADELGITVNTCRGYIKAVRQKLGVSSQLEAVLKARELGLVPRETD